MRAEAKRLRNNTVKPITIKDQLRPRRSMTRPAASDPMNTENRSMIRIWRFMMEDSINRQPHFGSLIWEIKHFLQEEEKPKRRIG